MRGGDLMGSYHESFGKYSLESRQSMAGFVLIGSYHESIRKYSLESDSAPTLSDLLSATKIEVLASLDFLAFLRMFQRSLI